MITIFITRTIYQKPGNTTELPSNSIEKTHRYHKINKRESFFQSLAYVLVPMLVVPEVERREFEYIRHATQSLIASFDVHLRRKHSQFKCVKFTYLNTTASTLYLIATPSTPKEARVEVLKRQNILYRFAVRINLVLSHRGEFKVRL